MTYDKDLFQNWTLDGRSCATCGRALGREADGWNLCATCIAAAFAPAWPTSATDKQLEATGQLTFAPDICVEEAA